MPLLAIMALVQLHLRWIPLELYRHWKELAGIGGAGPFIRYPLPAPRAERIR